MLRFHPRALRTTRVFPTEHGEICCRGDVFAFGTSAGKDSGTEIIPEGSRLLGWGRSSPAHRGGGHGHVIWSDGRDGRRIR